MGVAKAGNPAALNQLTDRLAAGVADVFPQMRAHYSPMQYRGGTAPVFGNDDASRVQIGPDRLCCSDNAPFQILGIPTVTFAGEANFYNSLAQPWSYPFDQPQDTPEAMACDAGGSPTPGPAMEAALELPTALSMELLQSYAPPKHKKGIAIISSRPRAGAAVQLAAAGTGTVHWTFGDGAQGTGASVHHTYKKAGTYTVRATTGKISRTVKLVVPKSGAQFSWPFGVLNPPPIHHWAPAELTDVQGCNGL
jgi:hypothetical protein